MSVKNVWRFMANHPIVPTGFVEPMCSGTIVASDFHSYSTNIAQPIQPTVGQPCGRYMMGAGFINAGEVLSPSYRDDPELGPSYCILR